MGVSNTSSPTSHCDILHLPNPEPSGRSNGGDDPTKPRRGKKYSESRLLENALVNPADLLTERER